MFERFVCNIIPIFFRIFSQIYKFNIGIFYFNFYNNTRIEQPPVILAKWL